MKRYEFHSALPPEAILARLHTQTRRWTRLDGWTVPNAWFLREQKDGALRLILTVPGRSHVFADLMLSKVENGTDITAMVSVTRTHILDITLIVLFALGLVIYALLRDGPDRWNLLLCFGWPLSFGIVMTLRRRSLDRRRLPELVKFIEDNLLE